MLRYTKKVGEVSLTYEGESVEDIVALVKGLNAQPPHVPVDIMKTQADYQSEKLRKRLMEGDLSIPMCSLAGCSEAGTHMLPIENDIRIFICDKHMCNPPQSALDRILKA